jgi:glycosyltransferase involved in cell wall biosynthesis
MDTVNKLLHLVFVGRLEAEKGIDVILGLIEYLEKNLEIASSIRLSICGDGTMRENILENTMDRRNTSFSNEVFDSP